MEMKGKSQIWSSMIKVKIREKPESFLTSLAKDLAMFLQYSFLCAEMPILFLQKMKEKH